MVIAYYCAPIITIMRKMLFFIIHPIAKGLDHLMGVHNHQRIQHKDFASYLTGNVFFYQIKENLKTNLKNVANINLITSMPKSHG